MKHAYEFTYTPGKFTAWHNLADFDRDRMFVIQNFWYQPHHRGYSNSTRVPFRQFCDVHEVLNARTPQDTSDKTDKKLTVREQQKAFVKKSGKQFKGLLVVL